PVQQREGLATVFQCLFCNHEKSVTIQMDKKGNIGNLQCKVCGVNFQQPITSISQPIDVYYEWVDACDAVAQEEKD
ncbi:transcription elongation factor 1, partial [Phyllosticta capitalensis]|uniref:transcription elongation factor 1 n=1 Tax=Phyllosticta capitalensis TaxID=121624 RepID=UPI00312D6126